MAQIMQTDHQKSFVLSRQHVMIITKCSLETLANSYDNSTAFTDQILANLAKTIAQRQNLNAAVLYLSDHGQSLGEDGLYMHGLPSMKLQLSNWKFRFCSGHPKRSKRPMTSLRL